MSRQAIEEVEYMEDGVLVKTVTDSKTARAIGKYKSIYHCVQSFTVTKHQLPSQYADKGFVREAILAQSRRLKILCIKDYVPNVPEYIIDPQYQCGILNTKTKEFERVEGGVELLYYKLFRGHVK
jgi:hypothetical protein